MNPYMVFSQEHWRRGQGNRSLMAQFIREGEGFLQRKDPQGFKEGKGFNTCEDP